MSLPTAQTADILKTDALELAGYPSPSATQLTQAEKWLRKGLNQIYKAKGMKVLEEAKIGTLSAFVQRYALPSDFDKILEVIIYYGTHEGVAQSGGANTLTLAADEDISEDDAKGKMAFLTSGTYQNQMARITAYNETTKQATVSPAWANTPTTEGYMIADVEKKLNPSPRETLSDVCTVVVPSFYHIYRRPKEIYFDSVVDAEKKYMMKLRYEVDLHYIDLADSRMAPLYNEFEEELVQCVFAYALKKDNDDRAQAEMNKFQRMLRDYKKKDARQRRVRGSLSFKSAGGMPLSD